MGAPLQNAASVEPADLEAAMEAWLKARGVALVRIPNRERAAAVQRLALRGEPSRRRALRLVALWSLAPKTGCGARDLSVRDMADFIAAEGFALIDAWGEPTLTTEETSS
ncbi:hypothetical protein [Parvularcula oceani]|uniref:hypothetical protein n=1 Tax=Parvularcula oceani TaxID=1247963 RepID=UPI0004E164BE|nr:hypothetical protein [Parvularcula oceani]